MATTTITTPNAPDLLTLVTDTESIVSSIDTLTSYLDSELAPSTVMGPAPAGDPVSFESIVPRLDQYLDEWLWLAGIPPNQITPRHRDELHDTWATQGLGSGFKIINLEPRNNANTVIGQTFLPHDDGGA